MFMKAIVLCLAAYSFDSTDNKTQWVNICSNIDSVINHSNRNNIEPEALIALTWHETRWRGNQVSTVGACGIAQVIPKYTIPRVSCNDLKDDDIGLEYGAMALRNWLNHANNNLTRAYCHYNSGNNCYTRGLSYARRVKRSYRKIKRVVNNISQYLSINFLRRLF